MYSILDYAIYQDNTALNKMTSLKSIGTRSRTWPSNKTGLLKLAFTNGSAKDQKSISTIPFFNSLTMSNFKSIHKKIKPKENHIYCKTSS
jgi:hypothetical protein